MIFGTSMLHPALRIILLLLLAIVVQFLEGVALLVTFAGLSFPAAHLRARLLPEMLRRSRWLLLALWLVPAFSVPGEYLAWWPWTFAPTYEGIMAGSLQVGRMGVMLAGLAWLLAATGRESLIAGMWALAQPLRYLGLVPERFAMRLWLTLHYAEQASALSATERWHQLRKTELPEGRAQVQSVVLELPSCTVLDCWVAGLAGGMLWWLV